MCGCVGVCRWESYSGVAEIEMARERKWKVCCVDKRDARQVSGDWRDWMWCY
jgi:hypothetical protein